MQTKRLESILSIFVAFALVAAMLPALAWADDSADSGVEAFASSWRYLNGSLIDSDSTSGSSSGISLLSIVEDSSGNSLFDDFDTYSKGYCTGKDAYKGIDVSKWQGDIDWAKVKAAGVDYAIIRCGYGSDEENQDDEKWLQNVKGCLANGIPFGVYLYSYATDTSMAKSEAEHVIRLLKKANLTTSLVALPIYLDMEDSSTASADLASIATTFCNAIKAAGYTPGVYANLKWWEEKLTASCFDSWAKWIAEWNTSQGLTDAGSKNFESADSNQMWQFSSYGKVDGIDGRVDLNYTYMPAAGQTSIQGAIAMYRLYNKSSGEHLYTSSTVERTDLIQRGWVAEGIGWYAPDTGDPVYRLYNPYSGDHHYTMDKNEYDSLAKIGWKQEGIGWYSDATKGKAVYRQFNPNEKVGTHNYSVDKNENDTLVKLGWKAEGIGWYALSDDTVKALQEAASSETSSDTSSSSASKATDSTSK
jgi:GH25 family lysozyme M1 (1,4-beta-N-acetylmuramidase)